MNKQTEAFKLAIEAAYLSGFNASGEGWNAQYPFDDKKESIKANASWIKSRDKYVSVVLVQQREPEPKITGTFWAGDAHGGPVIARPIKMTHSKQPERPWVGLTPEERREIFNRRDWAIDFNWEYELAIEAKLKEKNT